MGRNENVLNQREFTPKRGDIVSCNHDFHLERLKYRYNYPRVGDMLTINGVAIEYDTHDYLLTFRELKIPVPLYAHHFLLVQSAGEGDDILQEVEDILQK
jgi:hypothetical protein